MTRQGRGWLTTLNPLLKLAAVVPAMIITLLTRDPLTPATLAAAATVVVLTGLRIGARTLAIVGGLTLVVASWTALLFSLLVREDLVAHTPVIFEGWVTLRSEALVIGASTALRLLAVMMLAILGSAGTTTDGLASALVNQLRIPYRFAYGTLAAARFAPRYRDDLVTLRSAQRARGIIDPPGPVGFLRQTGRSAIPLLAGGARYAERLSLAMDARGFGAHPRRSDRSPQRVRTRDLLFTLLAWTATAALIVTMSAAGFLQLGSNPFEQGGPRRT